jgi:dTDP-4-dehydrorhamnose reductase
LKILLLGKNGQVGWELQRSLAPIGKLIALDRRGQDDWCGDFTNLEALASTVRRIRPDVIVNAAAYTAVDQAESDISLARAINALAPAALASEAASIGAWLVHYSTDYVFDGSGSEPWREESATSPLNTYGRTKLEGENAIVNSGCHHLVFRTSWVYSARGGNFARTMLRLAEERETLNVIDDQHGAPTGADLLADCTAHALRAAMQRPSVCGVYHLAPGGETSWHGYALHVIERARQAGRPLKLSKEAIRAVSTNQFPTVARRPSNSRLDTLKLRTTFDLSLPDWRAGVDRMLTEVLAA